MNTTIALVNEWGAFEGAHPDGNIEDFCRYYLARQQQDKEGTFVGGIVPASIDGVLLKIIGRIHKLNMFYVNMILKETEISQIDEFGLLTTIQHEKNPKKTEVIYANLLEFSSGTDMLNRLKKRGLLTEYDDTEDKRSKRLKLTAKGEKVLSDSLNRIKTIAEMMLYDREINDKELCVQLLKGLEIKFSALWHKHKGKNIEEIYEEVSGKKADWNK